mmetsp:Transcript_28258/g.92233  ORF Transcript_28258/g.92233 Transcript_28258/m.92233 type:complete len:271 (+) Transcript_28258:633-1445(+)
MRWLPSREKWSDVTPSPWACSYFRRHCPDRSFHTLIFPSCDPEAIISLSRLKATLRTAVSCIMKASSAWYCRSFFSFPEMTSHTSRKPSTDPVTRHCPSGEKAAHSGYDFFPNFIVLDSCVGCSSDSSWRTGAVPRKRSNAVPGGRSPWCCCHLSACPISAINRDGGTTVTSFAIICAMMVRRRSFVLSRYASRGSKCVLLMSDSSRVYRSGWSCFICDMTLVWRSITRAVSSSRSSIISKIHCSYKSSSLFRGTLMCATCGSTESHRPF